MMMMMMMMELSGVDKEDGVGFQDMNLRKKSSLQC